MNMTELRVRSRLSPAALEARVGKILTEGDYDVLLTGPTRVAGPDGRLLCVYLPGVLKAETEVAYPVLTTIRAGSNNRGLASGTAQRVQQNKQFRAKPVTSSIIGAFEASGYYKFCRLTTWTAREAEGRWPELLPYFQAVADHFKQYVPDRYAAQMRYVKETDPAWVIPGTPYTTVTVNNSYPTGVHQDAGDLDEGFSCLAVARRGNYTGGRLTFPEFRIAVDLQDGDLMMMDAHQWHGNTKMRCECGNVLGDSEGSRGTRPCLTCGAERVSVVLYYRTKMRSCGSSAEEAEKAQAWAEKVSLGS